MKKTLLLLTITGALVASSAQTTTNYSDVHDIKNSKSNVLSQYVDIHDIKNSHSTTYANDK